MKIKSKHRRIVAVVLIIALLLYVFPVYRIALLGGNSHYYGDRELVKLIYRGSIFDCLEVQPLMRKADAAFQDYTHTRRENMDQYGLLFLYAIDTDFYDNVIDVKHSLKLWSAHLDDKEGVLWVYYFQEAIDSNGNIVCGSWRVPSIWCVEKDEHGEWFVEHIYEHP